MHIHKAATAKDYERILAAPWLSMFVKISVAELRERASLAHIFYATNARGDITGTVLGVVPEDPQNGTLFLSQLNVDPLYQKRGIGRDLVAALIKTSVELGLPCSAAIHKNNSAAKKLAERFGFVVSISEEPNAFDPFLSYCRPPLPLEASHQAAHDFTSDRPANG